MGCRSRSDPLDLLILLGIGAMGAMALFAPQTLLAISPGCLITALTHQHCWGCGMTRAILKIFSGEFSAAWALNPRVVVVFPLLCVACFTFARRVVKPWLPGFRHLDSGA